jgi:hypothetical protein
MADRPNRCAYSLDGTTWVEFPKGPRFDICFGIEEQNINLETDRGQRFIYSQFTRDRWDLTFRFSDTDRQNFQDFHDAVDGQLNKFYLTVGANGSAIALMYGIKTVSFLPAGISIAAIPVIYEYKFSVLGEIANIPLLTTDFLLPGPFAGVSFGGLW